MAHWRYPRIRKEDYPAMKKLMGDDLPPMHERLNMKSRKGVTATSSKIRAGQVKLSCPSIRRSSPPIVVTKLRVAVCLTAS